MDTKQSDNTKQSENTKAVGNQEFEKELKEFCENVPYDHPAGTSHKVIGEGKYILFLTIRHDEFSGNPLTECDGMGKIVSFNSRHINSVNSHEEAEELLNQPGAVALSYYEHGLCKWSVRGRMGPVQHEEWDMVGTAGVWLPDDAIKDLGLDDKTLLNTAEAACEEYTSWCNGEVYEYVVKIFKVRKEKEKDGSHYIYNRASDYRRDTPVFEDGCCGFYGRESAEEAAFEEVKWQVEEIMKKDPGNDQ